MTEPDADFAAYFAGQVGSVRRIAYALCGDWHTADDLVQITFVKLYPRWRRVRDGSVDAYVRRILVNTYLSHVRKHRREKVVAEVPDAPAPQLDTHEDLGQALRRLPAQQRAVVVLRHLEDLSIADVAEVLQLAEGTVKSQSARGIAALRAVMSRSVQPKEL
ncbi:SigE family RNA polymerase sigma factor [Actinoplanes couchii]|uniref:DNA-directed RNA polymerase sigma-70 factor n=1 Tax=Actinoplanes couchii TaxID=403638 RepID=A0ABQ3X1R3_9ACTN|nr:SigE family RNA polymerase sigma factor [Actinoplanes couchii]MDR6316742.1 RNA polymerase sigma-70 factor (sigma-E family) [Actinoplanes couchii]GID52350.1 DNA-directed RNA polymerase sigma-70 factor [Actinoplanes couchii]